MSITAKQLRSEAKRYRDQADKLDAAANALDGGAQLPAQTQPPTGGGKKRKLRFRRGDQSDAMLDALKRVGRPCRPDEVEPEFYDVLINVFEYPVARVRQHASAAKVLAHLYASNKVKRDNSGNYALK